MILLQGQAYKSQRAKKRLLRKSQTMTKLLAKTKAARTGSQAAFPAASCQNGLFPQ